MKEMNKQWELSCDFHRVNNDNEHACAKGLMCPNCGCQYKCDEFRLQGLTLDQHPNTRPPLRRKKGGKKHQPLIIRSSCPGSGRGKKGEG